ncbi:MAG: type II toxin-antitoxin system HicA family toxin [Phycisphaerae bacterium]|nr:type II toxin-antitoxin system HicA family toxin [Phycisphaerae bacterium]
MPSDVSLRDLRRVLEEIGYTLDRVKGSHHHFRGPNLPPIGFPVHHGKVKAVYARQIERIIKGLRASGEGR